MKIIIFLFFYLSFFTVSHAQDMSVDFEVDKEFVKKGLQYHVEISCELKFNPRNFQGLMSRYLSRLDRNGNYGKIANYFRPNFEVFHGVILSKSIPTLSGDFTNASSDIPAGSVMIPVFFGKREGAGLSYRLVESRYFDGFCPDGIFLAGGNDFYITPVFMYSDVKDGPSFISTLIGAISELAPKLSLAFLGADESVEFNAKFNEEYPKVADLVTFLDENFRGPRAKIVIKNPVRVREGRALVTTELSRFELRTYRQDNFLFAKNEFRRDFNSISDFLVQEDLTNTNNINEFRSRCRKYDNQLIEAGLGAPVDRAYLIYRRLVANDLDKTNVVRCFDAALDETGQAVLLSGKRANTFYHNVNKQQRISAEDFYRFENEVRPKTGEGRKDDIPLEFSAAETEEVETNLFELVEAFRSIVSYENQDEVGSAAVQKVSALFRDTVVYENLTGNRNVLPGVNQLDGNLEPINLIRKIGASGRRLDCPIFANNVSVGQDVAQARTKRRIFQDADVALIAFDEKSLDGDQDNTFKESLLIRLEFQPVAGAYKVVRVEISDSGAQTLKGYSPESCIYLN